MADVVVDRFSVKASDYREQLAGYQQAATDADLISVGKFTLRLGQRLGSGHSTDVFLATRATRLSEALVVKRLRVAADEPLLENEQRVLAALEQSNARGAEHFTTLLPQRVASGRIASAPEGQRAYVFREPAGFAHTLSQVTAAHGAGLDTRHLVWLGRRVLELLGFLHRSGFVHAAVLPAHILVDAASHGARLVGYSCAAAQGSRLGCVDDERADLYPVELLNGRGREPRDDVAMLARSLLSTTAPSAVPEPLLSFLQQLGRGEGGDDAWQAERALGEVAQRTFGAPRFVKLEMP